MENDIRYIIETHPYLLNLYQKEDLRHIKDIYFAHLKHKRIIETEFSFLQFVQFCNESGYEPHKFSIIRYDVKKPFSADNIQLKKANNYQKKLDEMSKIIKKTERHKVKIKLNDDPYIVIKSDNLTKKPAYKLNTKQKSITSKLNSLIRYYPKKTLIILQSGYGERKKRGLLADGFTFEKYIVTLHVLGYIDGSQHKICRIDTTKKFDENNIILKKADGLLKKIQDMARIVHENKRVSLKINEEPFQICLKHPNAKYERRIYIKQ